MSRVAKRGFEDGAQFGRLTSWHGERVRWVLDAWTETWLSTAFRHWSLTLRLADVHCPVLAIHCEEDEFGSSAFPRAIAGGVSRVEQMALLPACGHVPHRERVAEVLTLVEAFLSRYPID